MAEDDATLGGAIQDAQDATGSDEPVHALLVQLLLRFQRWEELGRACSLGLRQW